MEGDRWFELKRNGCPEWWVIQQSGSTLPVKYVVRRYLYTMPVSVRDIRNSQGKTPRTRVMNFESQSYETKEMDIFRSADGVGVGGTFCRGMRRIRRCAAAEFGRIVRSAADRRRIGIGRGARNVAGDSFGVRIGGRKLIL